MPYELVSKPVPGPRAFAESSDAAVLSQTAILFLLGHSMESNSRPLTTSTVGEGAKKGTALIPREEWEALSPPRVRWTRERLAPAAIEAAVAKRISRPKTLRKPTQENIYAATGELAERVYKTGDPSLAAALLLICYEHPHWLPRIAAASTLFGIVSEPAGLLSTIEAATVNEDETVRQVAATVLGRLDPTNPRLAALTSGEARIQRPEPAHTSLLVHGTFAAGSGWWQPGGDFHNYILNNVRPDLYSAPDRFEWSGGYSDQARAIAARDLQGWVSAHGAAGLDILAHSHGGNVAMLASQNGMAINKLILLSCPVHWNKYNPNLKVVKRAISVRVKLDLVILADRGGQRFPDPPVEEHVLPGWFLGHSSTHDHKIWTKYGVPHWV